MAERPSGELVSADIPSADLFEDPVIGQLVAQVLTMRSGDQFPNERDLALQHGVSRPTLRARLSRLEAMGVLERRPRSGTFVRPLRAQTVTETLVVGLMSSNMRLSSLSSVRVALERQAAGEAARAADQIKIGYIAAAQQRMDRAEAPDRLYEADLEFHQALFAASNSPGLEFFADVLRGVLSHSVQHRQARIQRLTQDTEVIRTLHRSIYQAVYRGDHAGAMQAMDTHFDFLDRIESFNQQGHI